MNIFKKSFKGKSARRFVAYFAIGVSLSTVILIASIISLATGVTQ